LTTAATAYFLQGGADDCSAYKKGDYSSCDASCGQCFNPEGRDGVMCPSDSAAGYYCPDENNFGCLDWNFGSKNM